LSEKECEYGEGEGIRGTSVRSGEDTSSSGDEHHLKTVKMERVVGARDVVNDQVVGLDGVGCDDRDMGVREVLAASDPEE
jgi:hypothetical protein